MTQKHPDEDENKLPQRTPSTSTSKAPQNRRASDNKAEQTSTSATSSSAPAPPPKPRAPAPIPPGGSLPSNTKKKLPAVDTQGLLDAAPTSNFYGAAGPSSSSSSKPAANVLNQPPPSAPKTKKPVKKAYVEIDSERGDTEDEEAQRKKKATQPRGRETSRFTQGGPSSSALLRPNAATGGEKPKNRIKRAGTPGVRRTSGSGRPASGSGSGEADGDEEDEIQDDEDGRREGDGDEWDAASSSPTASVSSPQVSSARSTVVQRLAKKQPPVVRTSTVGGLNRAKSYSGAVSSTSKKSTNAEWEEMASDNEDSTSKSNDGAPLPYELSSAGTSSSSRAVVLHSSSKSAPRSSWDTDSDSSSAGPRKPQKYFEKGWTLPKLFQQEGEHGGIQGLFEHGAWHVEVFDTPAGDESKWKAMGARIDVRGHPNDVAVPPKDKVKSPKVEGDESRGESNALPRDEATFTSNDEDVDGANKMDVEVTASSESKPLPSSTLNETDSSAKALPSLPVPLPFVTSHFQTPTRAELDFARPHPSAFFSVPDHAWFIFHAIEPPPNLLDSDHQKSHVDLWRYVPGQGGPKSVAATSHLLGEGAFALQPPFAPANPDTLPSEYIWYRSRTGSKGIVWDAWVGPKELNRLVKMESSNGWQALAPHKGMDWYPCVIPRGLWEDLLKMFEGAVKNAQGPNVTVLGGVNVIYRAIDNILFSGNTASMAVNGKAFGKYFKDWNTVASSIWIGILGFKYDEAACTIAPPPLCDDRPEGDVNRRRLLRCWLELAIWMEDQRLKTGPPTNNAAPKRIGLRPYRDVLIPKLGGDYYPRKSVKNAWTTVGSSVDFIDATAGSYNRLGVLPTFADSAIIDVYDELKKREPRNVFHLLTTLEEISTVRGSDELNLKVVTEKSQGHFTQSDINKAYESIDMKQPAHDSRSGPLEEENTMTKYNEALTRAGSAESKRRLRENMDLICKYRESEVLQVMLMSMTGEEKPKMELGRAFKLLNPDGDDKVGDDMLIAIYGIRVMDSPGEHEVLKEAMTVIGEHRHSDLIKNFLKTGSGDPEDVVMATDRPVGLTNIANTCYLNSLLQYFFTIRELRDTILNFHAPGEIAEVDQLRRVGGRLVTKAEIERSNRFVILLQTLYTQLIHASSSVTPETELAYLALVPSKEEVQAKTEADLAVAQKESTPLVRSPTVLGKRAIDALHADEEVDQLASPTPTDDAMAVDSQSLSSGRSPLADRDINRERRSPTVVVEGGRASPKIAKPNDPFSLDDLPATEAPDGVMEIGLPPTVDVDMAPPAADGPPPLPPRPSKKPDLEKEVSSYMAFGRQNDVTECMDNVMFQIEAALNSADKQETEAESVLKRTFYGKMRQQLEIDDPAEKEPLRIKEEPFFSLLVDVAEEGRDVYDGLDTVFDDSIVDIEGKQARRRISLVTVPPILQIQLQRVQFNREEQRIFKSNAHMSFGDTISMDRYLEVEPEDSEGLERRDSTNRWRREIEEARGRLDKLTKRKDSNVADVLRSSHAQFLDLRESLFPDLSQDELDLGLKEASELEEDIARLSASLTDLRKKITDLWSTEHKASFELVAVFIHRGTALSGHYYIYMRDSKNPSKWLKYNDSIVSEVSTEEVFKASNSDTNPYFLVYARKDKLDAVDTICRN